MKYIFKTLIIIFISTSSLAGEYAVVVNKNMKTLSISQIKAIFLKKLTLMDEKKIVPVNLAARDKIRVKFEKEILHMSFSRLKAYWASQHYLGHRPPISMKSEESVKAFIKKVDNSIGYINVNNLDDDLKVIYRWRD